jgi:hypothetical protein
VERGGLVAQVIECLPSNCKALSSNPSTIKLEKKKITVATMSRTDLGRIANVEVERLVKKLLQKYSLELRYGLDQGRTR